MLITLIHNPSAGKQSDAKTLKRMLHQAGHEVRYRSTKESGWKRALKKEADLIVVAGGDGTVGRVLRRVAGRKVPLAILPAGTANNIARTLGQVERPFEELAESWEKAPHVRLDICTAKGPWGERKFVEAVGLGVFPEIMSHPKSEEKHEKRRRKGNAVEEALQDMRRAAERADVIELTAMLDGKDISGRYLMLEALNLHYVGPNMRLAVDAKPGDNHFEVVLVGENERDRLAHYLERWQEDRDRLAVLPSHRGKRLLIEWNGLPLHIDDKLYPQEDPDPEETAGMVEVTIDENAAVEVLVPQ